MSGPDYERRRRLNTEAKRRAKIRTRLWLKEYLQAHPCVDCGEHDLRVLEFDHMKPEDKTAGVSRLAGNGASLARVQAEVAKCEVRCANCHRRRTIEEGHATFRRLPNVTVYDTGG